MCYLDSGDDSDNESDGPLFVEDNSSEEEDLNFPNWSSEMKNVYKGNNKIYGQPKLF